MEATDTVPTFLLFAFQGCNAPGLFGGPFDSGTAFNEVRPVTIPLILMLIAAVAMLLGTLLWWREVEKRVPMVLFGLGLAGTLGFLVFQVNDVSMQSLSLETFLNGGNYFIAVGEFSFYLVFVMIMIFVSLILVAREVGWETERNLLILATGGTVVLALCWLFFSIAVWNCV